VAVATVTPAVSPAQLTIITSEEISRYAEITSQLSQLEAQQKALRSELLDLHTAGAEQETDSPYLLAFVDQDGARLTGRITLWLWPKSCTASRRPSSGS
jgi:hypothetical protein